MTEPRGPDALNLLDDTMPLRTLSMLVLAAAALFAGGCVKMKQVVTVMPDGSGKLVFTLGVRDQLSPEGGRDPLARYSLENMLEDGSIPAGVVALTAPQRWEDGGYQFVTYTMYFEDINAFEAEDDGDMGQLFSSYTFERGDDDEGCSLVVAGGMMRQVLADYEQREPEEQELMRKEMEGIELVEHFILPGEAEEIDGVTMADNTADITIVLDTLIDGDGPIEALDGGPMTLVVPEDSIDQAVVDAFAAELARAILNWQAMLEEMEAE